MFPSKCTFAKTLSLLTLAGLALACGASPDPQGSESTSSSVTCLSDGVHVESCTPLRPGPITAPAPTPVPDAGAPDAATWTCSTDSVCEAWPADYTEAQCPKDKAFEAELQSMGCQAPLFYTPVSPLDVNEFYIAWCPSLPADTGTTWQALDSCNTCTGEQPGPSWVLVAWTDAPSITCGGVEHLPGTVCNKKSCLAL